MSGCMARSLLVRLRVLPQFLAGARIYEPPSVVGPWCLCLAEAKHLPNETSAGANDRETWGLGARRKLAFPHGSPPLVCWPAAALLQAQAEPEAKTQAKD